MSIVVTIWRTYDQYREMKAKLMKLGETTAQRLELDLTHRLTFAASTSYTDMDGVTVATTVGDGFALAYSLHIVPGASTTYRNIVANNPLFSKGGLEAAETLFATQMIDSAGNKVVVRPDTIVTTDDPNTVNTVLEFLNSTADPEGSHSGVYNTYKAKYRHVVLPYLATAATGAYNSSKAKYWFLMDVAHTDAICEISENPHMVSPTPGSNADEFENDDWRFKSSAAYGIEIVDPKFVVMSKGDGTA